MGTFGKVFECVDLKYEDFVAVKVVRKIRRYVDSAVIEADILKEVRSLQRVKGVDSCVKMYDHFHFKGELEEYLLFESILLILF